MKVYISADIEGVNGILDWEETEMSTSRYQALRLQMTKEVIAACEAAYSVGAKEIVVKDAHDSAANLNIADLPPYVKLVRGWSGHPFEMMQELDDSFDAVLLIGYHSASRSQGNPLSHTKSVSRLHHIKINGEIMSEFMINTYLASYVNVPVVFVSGDMNLCQEIKKVNQHIEVVETNVGVGKSIICSHPSVVLDKIRTGVKRALSNHLSSCEVQLPKTFDVEICFSKHASAYKASFYPGVTKIADDTITYKTNDYFEVLRMMNFVI